MKWLPVVLALVLGAAGVCSGSTAVSEEGSPRQAVPAVAGVTQTLARARARRLAAIEYRLHFDIPADQRAPIPARALISFDLADNDAPLQLDFRQDPSGIRSLRINGADADPVLVQEHIILPAAGLRTGRNEVAIEFLAGDSALNRNPDFLYTLFVPDRARTAFPLFDQPDLKARFTLTLELPPTWKAVANAPLAELLDRKEGRREYRFAPSDLISSYLFSFVAGEFQAITRDVNQRTMTMLHREADAAKVARNADAIFELHGQSLSWLEEYTGIPYPFRKFDFVLLPYHPYSGMEHVGAIQYKASALLLGEAPTLVELLDRAQLIAHETAHMWFGDLVTMKWFDDVWTKEVFASFMAGKMVNPSFPGVDHALDFEVSHYPGAYAVDRSQGANPIRQALPNLNQAGSLYGDIIYHKAPIMMRQLELIVGEEGLRAGLAQYLRRYSHGNATWPDLIALLDRYTDIDLAAWSEVWVNTPGRPHFSLVPGSGPAGGPQQLLQEDPAGLGRVWPQHFELLRVSATGQAGTGLVVRQEQTALPPAGEPPLVTLFNADGLGYGLFPADLGVLAVWDRLQPVQKGAALINVHDNVLAGRIADIAGYLELLLDIVRREQDPLLLDLALAQAQYSFYSLLDETRASAVASHMEDLLWETTLAQPDSSRTRLLFKAFAQLASSRARVRQLYDIWRGTLVVDRLILEEDDRVELAQTLAIRMPAKADEIIARQLAAMTDPDRRRRLAFIAPSVAADPAVRDAFFASLRQPQNRHTESWVGDALRNLHHPSRLQQSEKYLLPSLELLQEIQETGDIFFPGQWLNASLGNYHSQSAAYTVRAFLARRPDYNPQLRMKILQAADGLFRAAAIRAGAAAPAAAAVEPP
jgi:aminopeptidase N